jgi:hypothetical protein
MHGDQDFRAPITIRAVPLYLEPKWLAMVDCLGENGSADM